MSVQNVKISVIVEDSRARILLGKMFRIFLVNILTGTRFQNSNFATLIMGILIACFFFLVLPELCCTELER